MIVRIFTGSVWAGSAEFGDFEFDALPAVGHKIAFAYADGWQYGKVRDIAHRFGSADAAADIALLLSPLAEGGDPAEPLPLAGFDSLEGSTATGGSVPRAGPWGSR